MYGHTLGAAVGLGYIATAAGETIGADDFDIEVAGIRYPASASLRPLYDPTNERIKGRSTP